MGFKWNKGEHESWYKKINKFNRKIEQAKKSGYKEELPLKINYKERLKDILSDSEYSRREFNNQMKAIDIFLEKNSLDVVKSERGAHVPKWEIDTINKVILKDINKNNKEFKKQNEKILGKKENSKLNPNETRDRKLKLKYKSQNEFQMFVETFNDFNRTVEQKNKATREGYYKAIKNEIGGENNVMALAIKGLIDQLPDDIITANALYNEMTMFNYVYSKDDFKTREKMIKSAWTKIYKDYMKQEENKRK